MLIVAQNFPGLQISILSLCSPPAETDFYCRFEYNEEREIFAYQNLKCHKQPYVCKKKNEKITYFS